MNIIGVSYIGEIIAIANIFFPLLPSGDKPCADCLFCAFAYCRLDTLALVKILDKLLFVL